MKRRVATLKICRWSIYVALLYFGLTLFLYGLQTLDTDNSPPGISLNKNHQILINTKAKGINKKPEPSKQKKLERIHFTAPSSNNDLSNHHKIDHEIKLKTKDNSYRVNNDEVSPRPKIKIKPLARSRIDTPKESRKSAVVEENPKSELQEQTKDPYDNRYQQVIQEALEDGKYENINKTYHDNKNSSSKTRFSHQEMKEIEEEMEERNKLVADVCMKNGLGSKRGKIQKVLRYPPSANYDILYIDRPDAFTWCPVYKAASTSWLNILCILAGIKESTLRESKQQISHTAREVWPALDYDEASSIVPETTKFMIVRHPFERIVSAYRDKLENINVGLEHGVLHFYEKYGKKIVQKYRKEGSTRKNETLVRNNNKNLPEPSGLEPTFPEFVQYLIDTDLVLYADDHWIPYYLFCSPCYISYDVIAKFETLERDQKYLLQKLNLDAKVNPKWMHLTKGMKTSDVVKRYMNTLDNETIRKLAQKYEIDFKMYGYSYVQYLH